METSIETRRVSLNDLKQHNTASDCWIAVHSKVWDITHFINEHPGGPEVLLNLAGSDATELYNDVHAPDIIEDLPSEKLIGLLEESAITRPIPKITDIDPVPPPASRTQTNEALSTPKTKTIPPIDAILSAPDYEKAARDSLSAKTWAFYSSAATDLVTYGKNKELVRRVMIRPRILRNVSQVNYKASILGFDSSAPFFISPAAMARLAHPDGELALSRAAANEGIIQCISSNASFSLKSIVKAAPPTQPFFFQLYVNSNHEKTIELLKTVGDLGVKAIFVTVDAPVPGKREADERAAQEQTVKSAISGGESSKDKKGSGFGRLMAQYIDKSLCWDDLAWIREACGGLPIVLKGVQTAEDVIKAAEYGVEGVLLSNHGGRSAQASILVLLELRKNCPEVFDQLEVYIDGGFDRGSDILKAIALGATAVGIGRPFLYSLIHGQDGAEHLCHILKDELETSMRLCGITSLSEARPSLVNTLDVDHMVVGNAYTRLLSKL
ncbi:probable CYB2-lactate dehydrogenase cytochrome b2 [Fusarium fujikuroi]|nr:probable CYB2-lactate dehydrogenase cytochrome b2 [Fusarium fujikuroi]SCO10809.1 probable CYB2-lactate dehydrogenase cytochrome b2 [Fusarium fujikuroi]SCO13289.1 probable CYB2-lactate dehydrogenase cytochrome b2 [Fusarium fujikuroi]SCO17765.1 probable CYB2-lactate dehydrogenase cytochrome b2 [Fusarium fujikuroi]SCO41074.1 probable CYB2-lactate dehydrogenase cytochrome b2 [Fusarium fujikuroi]